MKYILLIHLLFIHVFLLAQKEHNIWYFGDGNFSTEENPTHLYALGGDYTVSLTASILDHED